MMATNSSNAALLAAATYEEEHLQHGSLTGNYEYELSTYYFLIVDDSFSNHRLRRPSHLYIYLLYYIGGGGGQNLDLPTMLMTAIRKEHSRPTTGDNIDILQGEFVGSELE
jgi:hypothetical protein